MVVGRVRFADAERAWLDGDAERCLALCDQVSSDSSESDVALALLRARASLRLRRNGDTIAALAA
ncbi:MAG: hypothetical protein M3N49_08330, partial [Candidatus Eremiobacteraeota bacterium]|nr:hypothetical protein [Candidatus Eremiobacteraeota bacterium]